jgi:hypothetical protein
MLTFDPDVCTSMILIAEWVKDEAGRNCTEMSDQIFCSFEELGFWKRKSRIRTASTESSQQS